MKKIVAFAMAAAICISTPSFGKRDGHFNTFEVGESVELGILENFHFGFSGILGNNDLQTKTTFFRSQQFGFNMIQLAIHTQENSAVTIGANVEWNWFHLNKDYVWVPRVSGSAEPFTENGTVLAIMDRASAGIKDVKNSVFMVCTFGFPIDFNWKVGEKVTFTAGVTPELNLNGRVRFKGVNLIGENVSDTKSGLRFSKKIQTNLLACNLHAAVSYGNVGLYFKYRPVKVVMENYGPQFSTFTVGLVLGLGI